MADDGADMASMIYEKEDTGVCLIAASICWLHMAVLLLVPLNDTISLFLTRIIGRH